MAMGVAPSGSGGGVAAARRRGRARTRPMSEINVTPFVDVMLVLLIIFMVAAPLLTAGIELDLPESTAEALPNPDEPPLTISIDAAGAVFVQEDRVDRAQLPARLEAIAEARPSDTVFLRADRGLDYGSVMAVMGTLSAAGFRNISLVSDQRVAPPG
ncbi:MAG: protein TolR [Pseudomonadota bacterium]